MLSSFLLAFSLALPNQMEDLPADSVVISKDSTIPEAAVYDSVVVLNGEVDFYGHAQNLIVVGGTVRLEKNSEISDQIVLIHGQLQQMEGAQVPKSYEAGTTISSSSSSWSEWWNSLKDKWEHLWPKFSTIDDVEQWSWDLQRDRDEHRGIFSSSWIFLLPFALLAFLFFLSILFFIVAPRLSTYADLFLEQHPLSSLGLGFLGYLCIVPIVALLAITLIGIPLIPVFLLFVFVLVTAGFFAIARKVGVWILSRMHHESPIWASLIGQILLTLLWYIPILGHFLLIILLTAGTGALLGGYMNSRHSMIPPAGPTSSI